MPPLQTSALCLKLMPLLTLVGWLESKLRYRSVCVFLRKTEVRTPAPLLSSCTSRNAILPSDSFSSVNWMERFCPLRVSSCCRWCERTRSASSTGALVNRLAMSKQAMTSVSSKGTWWICFTKSADFLT